MYYSRYDNRPLIGVWALLIITLASLAVMLIPLYTNAGNPLWVKIAATAFPIAAASVASVAANGLNIVKKNFILPAFFVIVTMGAVGYDSGCWKGYASAAILFSIWYQTISTQHFERCAWNVFYIMAALAIGSLISGTMVLFAPMFLIGLALYDRFNLINLSASILGAGFVYALLYGAAYLFWDIEVVNEYISTLYHPITLIDLSNYEMGVYSVIGVYIITAFIAFISRFNSNSILFRRTMLFSYLFMAVAMVAEVLFGEKGIYETTVCIMCGVTLPFYAEFRKSKFSIILFYTMFCALIAAFVFKSFLL